MLSTWTADRLRRLYDHYNSIGNLPCSSMFTRVLRCFGSISGILELFC